ncbi:Type II secretory pathway, pullulanase PulA [Aquicoccus sp.]|uniref:Type II secretory pathway, pullulanase PulA n=1 Tax=Aquicoccus sp. TaxID=2055851 RepID=UPI0035689261
MIISRGRSYIFVHIPKTGGTALALVLEGRAMRDDIMLGDTPKAIKRRRKLSGVQSRGRLWKHSTLADIDGLIEVDEIADMLCFTLVRNPWDRMVSYYHWLREQSFDHPAVRLAKCEDFSGFLNHPQTQTVIRANPYAAYMRDTTGAERAGLYIRLEHFDTDAGPLWSHLGFRLDLPMANRSERAPDYRGYYSDADRRLVGALCAEDVARFGYEFD